MQTEIKQQVKRYKGCRQTPISNTNLVNRPKAKNKSKKGLGGFQKRKRVKLDWSQPFTGWHFMRKKKLGSYIYFVNY